MSTDDSPSIQLTSCIDGLPCWRWEVQKAKTHADLQDPLRHTPHTYRISSWLLVSLPVNIPLFPFFMSPPACHAGLGWRCCGFQRQREGVGGRGIWHETMRVFIKYNVVLGIPSVYDASAHLRTVLKQAKTLLSHKIHPENPLSLSVQWWCFTQLYAHVAITQVKTQNIFSSEPFLQASSWSLFLPEAKQKQNKTKRCHYCDIDHNYLPLSAGFEMTGS